MRHWCLLRVLKDELNLSGRSTYASIGIYYTGLKYSLVDNSGDLEMHTYGAQYEWIVRE